MKTILLLALILALNNTCRAEESAKAEVLVVTTSKLTRSSFGMGQTPFPDRNGSTFPLNWNGMQFPSGTQLLVLVTLPPGFKTLATDDPFGAQSAKLIFLKDSTEKDLLTVPEGAVSPDTSFDNNRTLFEKPNADRSQLLLIVSALRAPRRGATSITGELAVNTSAGTKSGQTPLFSLNSGGGVANIDNKQMFRWVTTTPPALPKNSFVKSDGRPQKAILLTNAATNILSVSLMQENGGTITSFALSPSTGGMTIGFPAPLNASERMYFKIDYAADGGGSTIPVNFTAELGVQSE